MPRPKRASPKNLSLTEIQSELKQRQKIVRRLERQRARLAAELEGVNRQIFELTGVHPQGAHRPKNTSNLGDALVKLLRGREMTVSEAAEAVQAAGYATTANNFRTIVNQKLISDKRFRKVRRGVYSTRANAK
ncbi:MAG: hypothetical protein KC996_07985 [Phycisphaerales bacterium]|nr:hypothetical protein [Phycisphaerales bacterium]